ncbi:MAG: hypothetical protein M1826_004477 [Phylliscum demangeonii]|nr:MAG: hypothetical protein M1826_004477 [Phylliscum demangeonii]
MCYRLTERYSVCGCLYHRHSVDACTSFGQRGHGVQEKTILVGYACTRHSMPTKKTDYRPSSDRGSSDSGYSSSSGWRYDSRSSYR